MYKVRVGQADITPPVGYRLQGHDACKNHSTLIHDHLCLKTVSEADGL